MFQNKVRCYNCKGKHHTSLCSAGNYSDPSQTIDKEAQPFRVRTPALNPQASSWIGSNISSGERVALQTALAKVNGKKEWKVRVLFDSGSQKSFISAKVVGKLGLMPVRKEQLGIKAFGRNEAEMKERDVYQISIDPLLQGKSVVIEVYAVDEISTVGNIHVERVRRGYPYLKNIYSYVGIQLRKSGLVWRTF